MATSGLRGPFPLTKDGIDNNVTGTSAGAYALGATKDNTFYIVAREKPRHGLFSIPSRCFEAIVFARFRGFGLETLQFGKRNLRDSLSRRGVILCPLQGRRDSHEALSKATVGNGRSVPLAA